MEFIFGCGANHFQQLKGQASSGIDGQEKNLHSDCDILSSPVLLHTPSKCKKLFACSFTWSRLAVTFKTENDIVTQVTGFTDYNEVDKNEGHGQNIPQMYTDLAVAAVTDTDIYLCHQGQCLPSYVLQDGAATEKAVQLNIDKDQVLTATSFAGGHKDLYIAYDHLNFGKVSLCQKSSNEVGSSCLKLNSSIPLQLTPLDSGLSILKLCCGKEHVVMLSMHGSVYSYGLGSRGQLGHGSVEKETTPRLVEALEGIKVESLSAGGWHSAAVLETGDLYTWGWNESGQLGHPALDLHKDGCGSESQNDAVGIQAEPKCAFDIEDVEKKISSVSCGSRHTLCLTECGKVFATGFNSYGQLGLGHLTNVDQFTQVKALPYICSQIFASQWNSVFVCHNTFS